MKLSLHSAIGKTKLPAGNYLVGRGDEVVTCLLEEETSAGQLMKTFQSSGLKCKYFLPIKGFEPNLEVYYYLVSKGVEALQEHEETIGE